MRLLSLIVTVVVIAAILASSSAQLRNKPTGLHIAFAGKDLSGNANKMAVSWNTVNQTLTSKVGGITYFFFNIYKIFLLLFLRFLLR